MRHWIHWLKYIQLFLKVINLRKTPCLCLNANAEMPMPRFAMVIINVFGIRKIEITFLHTHCLWIYLFIYYLFPILILTFFLKVKKFSWLKRSLSQYAFKYSLMTITSVFFQLNYESPIFGRKVVSNCSTLIELLNSLFDKLWFIKNYEIIFYSK